MFTPLLSATKYPHHIWKLQPEEAPERGDDTDCP